MDDTDGTTDYVPLPVAFSVFVGLLRHGEMVLWWDMTASKTGGSLSESRVIRWQDKLARQ